MILVTVGTMLPFDRMVRVVDEWAARHSRKDVFAQIGDQGTYEPRHMEWARSMAPDAFSRKVQSCGVLVAHAGTGSFFLAQEKRKPIVLFPRLARLKEHTSDHQVHTATWLAAKPGVFVAVEEEDLDYAIARAGAYTHAADAGDVSPFAPPAFIERIRAQLVV